MTLRPATEEAADEILDRFLTPALSAASADKLADLQASIGYKWDADLVVDGAGVGLADQNGKTVERQEQTGTKRVWGLSFFMPHGVSAPDVYKSTPIASDRYGVPAVSVDQEGKVDTILSDRTLRAAGSAMASKSFLLSRSTGPIEIILTIGQSNAGEGGEGGVLFSARAFPKTILGMVTPAGSVAFAPFGDTAYTDASFADFVGLYDLPGAAGVHGQYPATMIGFALEQANRDAGRAGPGCLAITAWEGGQPLSSFAKGAVGHHSFANAIAGVTAAKRIAGDRYGQSVIVRAVVFIQGESGPSGASTWEGEADAIFDDLSADIMTATGQTVAPQFLMGQTNVQGTTESNVCLGQVALTGSRADTNIAAPLYAAPIETDGIHTSALGRMMLFPAVADAYQTLVDTGAWVPVRPVSAILTGAVIRVTFEGTALSDGGLLSFDADWVPTVASKGFAYTDGSSPPAISSVVISGATTIDITLASTPSGSGKTLTYGMTNNSAATTWVKFLGNVMVETTKKNPFYWTWGFLVPRFIRHYSQRFSIGVT